MSFNSEVCTQFIWEYLRALDCPRALSVWLLFDSKEHEQLLGLSFNPLDYNSLVDARDSLAATKFLSKATFLDTSVSLRDEALKKFFEAEAVCLETNRRFSVRNRFESAATSAIIMIARRKIQTILGSISAFSLGEELVDACNWGPGATVSIKRRNATAPLKYQIESDTTADAHDLISELHKAAYPSWDIKPRIVKGNKVVTVPKNAKTDRTIAIEPGLNLWYQKGIGAILRRRLRRVGIDLNDQRHNQRLSRLGSKFNHLATVDFSMASDTISKRVVEELLPPDWFTLISAFRSSVGMLDGNPIYYQKFSSMGNGFTFELESLIFFALAHATCVYLGLEDFTVSVYGDDVILPSVACDLYYSVCAHCGFKVNVEKSYSSTPYRESCGEHFWNGIQITPIFLKEPIRGKTQAIRTANSVRLLSHRRNSYGCDRRLRRCWSLLAGYVGQKCPRIPAGLGDLGLVGNFDEAVGLRRPAGGQEGWLVPALITIPAHITMDGQGLLLFKLKSIGDSKESASNGNQIPMPLRTMHARKLVHVPRWEDLGPWI